MMPPHPHTNFHDSSAFPALLLVLIFCLGANCTKPAGPPPGGTDCASVCARLGPQGLNCVAFGPTDGPLGADGVAHPVPCETWLCQSHGLKSACLAKASTCEEADAFQTHGCPP